MKTKTNPIADNLLPDEEILWMGKPEITLRGFFLEEIHRNKISLPIIIFSILLVFIFILFIFEEAPIAAMCAVLMFVGAFMHLVTIFWTDYYSKYRIIQKTVYGVTNRRVFASANEMLTFSYINSIGKISLYQLPNGLKTIKFGDMQSIVFHRIADWEEIQHLVQPDQQTRM